MLPELPKVKKWSILRLHWDRMGTYQYNLSVEEEGEDVKE